MPKALVTWMQNTWRSPKMSKTQSAGLPIKRSELLWLTRKDEVFVEIAELLGVESADTTTPNWFHKRMVAIGNILERMTEEEQAELDEQGAKIAQRGYSEEQRRR